LTVVRLEFGNNVGYIQWIRDVEMCTDDEEILNWWESSGNTVAGIVGSDIE